MNQGRLASVPSLTDRQVVEAAEHLIELHCSSVGRERVRDVGLSFDDVYEETIYPSFGIVLDETQDLGMDENGNLILGDYDAVRNKARITNRIAALTGDRRRVFTCWHEIAHGILHGKWMRERHSHQRLQPPIVTTEMSLSAQSLQTLERQANIFAAHASAPSWLVRERITHVFGLRDRSVPLQYKGPSTYCFSINEGCIRAKIRDFRHYCMVIAGRIRVRFWGLSIEALSYRVEHCGLVQDCTRRHNLRRCG